jgi:UDP-N-acetylmuramoylalanine--D-glutamate ligase
LNKPQNILILGGGESGIGAAMLAQKLGHNVFVSDYGKLSNENKKELGELNILFEEGNHDITKIQEADLVIKSPGISNQAKPVQIALENSIEVISEIEYAYRNLKNETIIAITGSNGKTTTTLLTEHILVSAGVKAKAVGNIGYSFARALCMEKHTHYVVEVSSFQLDHAPSFSPHISILMNITPDHLDRYENSIEKYADSKAQIFNNQTQSDYMIYNMDDDLVKKQINKFNPKAQKLPFSIQQKVDGAYSIEQQLVININNPLIMSIHDLALKGKHNVQNSLAAGLAARVLEIRKEKIRESLTDFQSVEHRLEFVAKIHGIEFINDSKATNVNSTWYALESLTNPTVWIVGGVDKGNDYSILDDLVKANVETIICLGTDNAKIIESFSSICPNIMEAKTMEDAVKTSYELAKKGHSVLLSPACASFDLFENYEDRGNQFKKSVRNL